MLSLALILRSLLFTSLYGLWCMVASLIFAPFFFVSSHAALHSGRPWAIVILWLARHICRLDYEVRGREYVANTPVIYASKHQSAWDTMIFWLLMDRPNFVLKRELLRIPLWGWYLWRMQMIAIDRSGKAATMKHMIKQAKDSLTQHRSIIIFPEGTRTKPYATPHYHPGVVALYSMLKVPVVPVALNSGHYWAKNALLKKPGKIIIEFLPPIPAGLDKNIFLDTLQTQIENASARLAHEAQHQPKDHP